MQPIVTVEVVNSTKGTNIGSAIGLASTTWSRMVGLLGRTSLSSGEGLLIVPCSGVHTWGMRFPIDVVALDRHMRVLDVWENLGSFRIAAVSWRTRRVLELPAGTIRRAGISVGDELAVTPACGEATPNISLVKSLAASTGAGSRRVRGATAARRAQRGRTDGKSRCPMNSVACVTEQIVPRCVHAGPLGQKVRSRVLRLAVLFCLISSVFYVFIVLPPAAELRNAGIGADLYPAWYASRVVLVQHDDPYSPEVTARIQAKMYQGRHASSNEQRFAYPIFAILLFAPFAAIPFAAAQACFQVLAALLTVLAVFVWLGDSVPLAARVTCEMLTVSAFPVMLGLELKQPTMLVAAPLAGMFSCLRAGRRVNAGVLGALAAAKPQLATGVMLPMVSWSFARWPERKAFWISLSVTMGSSLGVSEYISHGWMMRWMATLSAYVCYAGAKPLVCVLPGAFLRLAAGARLVVASIIVCWKWSIADPFLAIGFSVSVFQFLLPFRLYNEVMLLPGVLWTAIHGPGTARTLEMLLRRTVLGWLGAGGLSMSVATVAQAFCAPSVTRLWSSPLVIAWLFPFALLAYLTTCAVAPIPSAGMPDRAPGECTKW